MPSFKKTREEDLAYPRQFESIISKISMVFEWIGALALLSMFLVNLVDVIGSKVFLKPFPGSTEVIGYMQTIAIAGAIAMTLFLGRHIRVEFFVDRFVPRMRSLIIAFSSCLGFLLFGLLSWQSFLFGISLKKSGEIGSTSHIPLYPFALFIAVACIPVCLVFLMELLRSFRKDN